MDEPGIRLLAGCDFTEAEMTLIREVVALFPRLSRSELAATLCEQLGWVTPAGRLKLASCLGLLEKVEAKGEFRLSLGEGEKSGQPGAGSFGAAHPG